MAIKIILTDEDALEWASHIAKIGEIEPLVVEAGIAETVSVAHENHFAGLDAGARPSRPQSEIVRPWQCRPSAPGARRQQIAADFKAKEEADYQAQVAAEVVADADPLARWRTPARLGYRDCARPATTTSTSAGH